MVEVVPPYVDTRLDQEHREYTIATQRGKDKAYMPITLEEYIEKFFLDLGGVYPADGSLKKNIGFGFS